MTQSTRGQSAKVDASVLDPLGMWPALLADNCLRMAHFQWDALSGWQQSFATFNKDLWEQWACRYAGGVPIDV